LNSPGQEKPNAINNFLNLYFKSKQTTNCTLRQKRIPFISLGGAKCSKKSNIVYGNKNKKSMFAFGLFFAGRHQFIKNMNINLIQQKHYVNLE